MAPSPNSYNTTGITAKGLCLSRQESSHFIVGKCSQSGASLHIKIRDLKKFSTPSPGAYNPQQAEKETKKSAAMYSFGVKVPDKGTSHGPGTSEITL